VLAALEGDRPDALWNLGDTVGYGPRPNECCALADDRAQLSLIGNHDLVALGDSAVDVEEFNPEAAAAAAWTRKTLSEAARAFLGGLGPSAEEAGVELYHGSPRDPVWEYVLTVEAARAALLATEAPLVLVGHSHVPLALRLEGAEVTGGLAPHGTEIDLSSGRWLLNPGSVGQPRDGDPRAAYCLLDFDKQRATFVRVGYPIDETQASTRGRARGGSPRGGDGAAFRRRVVLDREAHPVGAGAERGGAPRPSHRHADLARRRDVGGRRRVRPRERAIRRPAGPV
jgi:diadenosine tetraphosphatase ApaH/serine/threonine PP2A family protein phosphatase